MMTSYIPAKLWHQAFRLLQSVWTKAWLRAFWLSQPKRKILLLVSCLTSQQHASVSQGGQSGRKCGFRLLGCNNVSGRKCGFRLLGCNNVSGRKCGFRLLGCNNVSGRKCGFRLLGCTNLNGRKCGFRLFGCTNLNGRKCGFKFWL